MIYASFQMHQLLVSDGMRDLKTGDMKTRAAWFHVSNILGHPYIKESFPRKMLQFPQETTGQIYLRTSPPHCRG